MAAVSISTVSGAKRALIDCRPSSVMNASPVTMLLMFAAMIMLYEGSLLIARVGLRRRIKRQNEELAAEEDE